MSNDGYEIPESPEVVEQELTYGYRALRRAVHLNMIRSQKGKFNIMDNGTSTQ